MKFTLSRLNTRAEIDATIAALVEITESLRARSPLYNAVKNQEK
jgi:cysteine sulfinate desulfinase/cysteine desulfurase-like protein